VGCSCGIDEYFHGAIRWPLKVKLIPTRPVVDVLRPSNVTVEPASAKICTGSLFTNKVPLPEALPGAKKNWRLTPPPTTEIR
jgi:hypothetical protein